MLKLNDDLNNNFILITALRGYAAHGGAIPKKIDNYLRERLCLCQANEIKQMLGNPNGTSLLVKSLYDETYGGNGRLRSIREVMKKLNIKYSPNLYQNLYIVAEECFSPVDLLNILNTYGKKPNY